MIWTPYSALLIFLLPFFHNLFLGSALGRNQNHVNSITFNLIHRHAPQQNEMMLPSGPPETQLERVKELIHSDIARRKVISHKQGLALGSKRKIWETSLRNSEDGDTAKMRLRSAVDYGAAAYHVRFKVGTPGQEFMLAADTGSDLTWMKCRYNCDVNCSLDTDDSVRKRVFRAHESSSFRTIPCSTRMCQSDLFSYWALPLCQSRFAPCAYNYSYLDTSSALGIFAEETVSARLASGRLTRLQNVLIGCTESPSGFQQMDGVMGLGFSKYSFANKAAKFFGAKFSYCLVDHLSTKNVSSYLSFGENWSRKPNLGSMQYTKLLINVISPYYVVNIIGISIDDTMLSIPQEVWDVNSGGGTIFDSGTSLTSLAPQAYQPVMRALKAPLMKFKRAKADVPLEFCFQSTGFVEFSVPKLVFHFLDGAKFEPPVKSYIIDVDEGVKCIGFTSGAWPGVSIIGNIMQQNYFWEFDIGRKKLGFAPSTCT